MNKKIKIMVADDQPIVLGGMRDFLKDVENVELVGEALNGRDLLDLLAKRHTDIVLLDARMPVMDSKETLAEILKHHKDTRVIIFSFEKEMPFVVDYLLAGAHAYIIKDSEAKIYIETIFEVYHKGEYLSAEQQKALKNVAIHSKSDTPASLPLSAKQVKILIALCEEKSVKEIAAIYYNKITTVKSHIKTIKKKTNTKTFIGLFIYAIKQGLFKI